ncbi:hypothetical protein LXT21_32390 [Myxococcus sp. K38C18041901]|uniref:hypothetical protein n=1 Tax=Myxococcus guangdongensis TaxID=2906760 RepID=UPI0020A73F8B|nr:hypothetical protein [Myxococcus guangdongensis]MCP3063488.1 hypothetical protein [Myxococcus guangdongensis]
MSLLHEIKLKGAAVHAERISAPLFQDLLHIFVEGAQRALRFRIEGRSTARGGVPAWLRSAAQFDLLLESESEAGVFKVESRPLKQVLPEHLRSSEALADVGAEGSAVDLFEAGLEDALAGVADSDRFDEGLVETFSAFARLFDQGVEGIEVINGHAFPIDVEGVERVARLRRQTPPPRAIRIAGKLDAIRHSDRFFTLILESGAALRGVWERLDSDRVTASFGQKVIVSGVAVFRPSGSVLRIEAEHIEPASSRQATLWSVLPRPLFTPMDPRALRQSQDERSGLSAIFGQWPGEETEDEFSAALRELS